MISISEHVSLEWVYRFMSFETLAPSEAKAYVKKPRMGRATFPFFNQDLVTTGRRFNRGATVTTEEEPTEEIAITDEGEHCY